MIVEKNEHLDANCDEENAHGLPCLESAQWVITFGKKVVTICQRHFDQVVGTFGE